MSAGTRVVLYLGTAGCDAVVREAARATEPLLLLVPADVRLLGPHATARDVRQDLAAVAEILLERATRLAREELAREARALGAVLGAADRARVPSVEGQVLEGALAGAVTDALAGRDVLDVHAARDALDLLAGAGIDLAAALGARGPRLVAR